MSTNEGQRDTCLGSEIKSHLLKGLQRRKYPQKKVRFQLEYVETVFTLYWILSLLFHLLMGLV